MKRTTLSAAIFALTAVAGAASAEDSAAGQKSWEGFYAGGNIGGAWSTTCNTWEPGSVITGTPPLANGFYNRNCPNNSAFIGGLQFGYNFQTDRIVWGLDFDYDGWSTNKHNRSYTYAGATPPPNGTYTFNGNVSPSGFGLIHPRIGYAIDRWLPYFTAGTIIAGGSHNSTASFAPAGGSAPTASFSGGKNFTATGWIAGAGVEYGLRGPWSLKAEYLYVNLGKGNNTTTTCTASASACAAFSNFSLDNIHNSFTASLFRVGFNYRFGGEPKPAPAPPPPPPPPPLPPPPPPPPPKPAALCPDTPPGVAVDKYGCPCDVSQEVHFATDSASLTDEDMALLDKMIVNLKRLNFVDGEVGGYTDSTGSPAHNLGLAERRAQSVADYLTSHGISGGRLTVKGYGEANPVADNKTRAGRAHNRRVVVHRTDCNK